MTALLLCTLPLLSNATVGAPLPADEPPIEALVAQAKEDGVLHGSMLVARGDKVLARAAEGVLSPGGGPITLDTRFQIASLTKLMAQVATLRLAHLGKLDIDAPVGELVFDLPRWVAEGVTPRNLLEMTSGLPRELAPDPNESGVRLDEGGSVLEFFAGLPLEAEFPVGEGRGYSNVGYWLLGAVVEASAELPFAEATKALVFEPLGMSSTGLVRAASSAAYAMGLSRSEGGLEPAAEVDYVARFSSGGFFSTVEDLRRLVRSVASPDFVGVPGRELVLGAQGQLTLGGMLPGFMNALLYDAERDVTVISLNNLPAPDPNAFLGALREISQAVPADE